MTGSVIQIAAQQIAAVRASACVPVIQTFFDEPTFTATHKADLPS